MKHIYFFIILFFAGCEKDIYEPQDIYKPQITAVECDCGLEWESQRIIGLINSGGSFTIDGDTIINIDGIDIIGSSDLYIETASDHMPMKLYTLLPPPAVIPAEGMRKKKY